MVWGKGVAFLVLPSLLCINALPLSLPSERQGRSFTAEKRVHSVMSRLVENDTLAINDSRWDTEDLPFSTDLARFADEAGHMRKVDANLLSNRRIVTRERPVLWVHIHKSGGTFMCQLAAIAGEHVIPTKDTNCNWAGHDLYVDSGFPQKGVTCAERVYYFKSMGVSWGQLEHEIWDSCLCWDDFFYGTMLRSPIGLMRSMMNYHPHHGKAFVQDVQNELLYPSPSSLTQNVTWKFMDNFQIRVLASAMEVPAGKITIEHFDKARRVLDGMNVVARLEDLPNIGGDLFSRLGWSPDMAAYVGMPRNPSDHVFDFTQEEAEMLLELNKFDVALYESYPWST
eukprot:TRINITY_DN4595_c0_g1_i1.p1 TRINITY_DN4595_c0_g1~~TRINITY_DN4595_c0_g1_i1.p1  ORF type:complete len:340 (+),score=46.01 TRINITY_DN4595_c0_g1_i1:105-1124(+)